MLGGAPDPELPGPGYRWTQWTYAGGGRIEVLEPDPSPDGFLRRFLERRGPGIHHVTFKVPSLDTACEDARARGFDVVGYRADSARWKEAFLHPRQALGLVVQLAEAGMEGAEGDARRRPWRSREGGVERPPPVRVVGLRTRARSAERARLLWGEVVHGDCRERGAALVFRWPGSAMQIAVDIEPDEEEGPVAIELTAERALELPPGPVAPFGARFVQQTRG